MPKMTNAERCRAYYRKNREKLLEQKREFHSENQDLVNARQRAQYQKHKTKRVEAARQYRKKNAEEIARKAMKRYRANRDKIRARRKVYAKKNYKSIYAGIQNWRSKNPDRVKFYSAKQLLSDQSGIPFPDIPDELAEAKMIQLEISRTAQAIEARRAETTGSARESAVGKADASETP